MSQTPVALSAFLEFLLAAAVAVACFGIIGFGFLIAPGLPVRSFEDWRRGSDGKE
jgi:hypothetical protein